MKTIILDTNFLLHAVEYKIDIGEELKKCMDEPYETAIIETTQKELIGKKNENLARIWLEKLHVKLIKPLQDLSNVDQAIIAVADKNTLVATQDKRLKKRVNDRAYAIITIRQKKYFMIENVL